VIIVNNTISGTYKSYVYAGYGIMTTGHGLGKVTISGNTVTTSASDGLFLSSLSSL